MSPLAQHFTLDVDTLLSCQPEKLSHQIAAHLKTHWSLFNIKAGLKVNIFQTCVSFFFLDSEGILDNFTLVE